MKNLLAFTTVFAVGFVLGSRRAAKPVIVVAELKLRGQDLVTIGRQQNFRTKITD